LQGGAAFAYPGDGHRVRFPPDPGRQAVEEATGANDANREGRIMGVIARGDTPAEVRQEEEAANLLAGNTPSMQTAPPSPPPPHFVDQQGQPRSVVEDVWRNHQTSPPPKPEQANQPPSPGQHEGTQRTASLLVNLLWGAEVPVIAGEDDSAFSWRLAEALAQVVREQGAGGRGKRGPVTPPDLFKLQQAGADGLAEKAGLLLYL
jgi:hypothetical protein